MSELGFTKVLSNKIFSIIFCATLAALTLLLVLCIQLESLPWNFKSSQLVEFSLFLFAFILGLVLSSISLFENVRWLNQLIRAFAIGVLLFVTTFLLFRFLIDFHRPLAFGQFDKETLVLLGVGFVGLLLLYRLPIQSLTACIINLLLILVIAFPVYKNLNITQFLNDLKLRQGNEFEITSNKMIKHSETDYAFSLFHDMKISEYPVVEPAARIPGGGIDILKDNTLVLVTGDGRVLFLGIENNSVSVLPLELRTPFSPLRSDIDYSVPLTNYMRSVFRVTDMLIASSTNDQKTLYVSYHQWDAENSCVSLTVAQAELAVNKIDAQALSWEPIYRSSPCLSLSERGAMFGTTGGRMAVLNEKTLLLSVGTTLADKDWDTEELGDSDYGKIIAIDRRNTNSRIFTSGHRNPQGLYVTDKGEIWSTEHGPDGGDELNLIVDGNDYGWPISTYGSAYDTKTWVKNPVQGDHTAGDRPVFAWVPSIGISSVIKVKGSAFKHWSNDLLVGSLFGRGHGKSLYRVKTTDSAVQVVERISVGRTIRDLVELPNGSILLWDGNRMLQLIEPVEHVFESCDGCHAMTGFQQGIGPHLQGIVDAKVARSYGYNYSEALRNFGGRWTRDRLLAFIENPQALVPGTSMEFAGIASKAEREALVDYLEKLKR